MEEKAIPIFATEYADRKSIERGATAPSLDANGQQLVPRPSSDPEDPLNWPLWMKIAVLVQVSLLAALGTLNAAIIGPVFVPIADEFGISVVTAGYQTTVCIATIGFVAFLWVPLANAYGRRPVYVFTTLLGFGAAIGSASARSFPALVIGRVFMGAFPAAMVLGAATVADLFFLHQRGRAMGFYTVTLTTGSHVAPIIGGLIGQFLGWRWCLRFAGILNGVMFLVILFCLPETLYVRAPASGINDVGLVASPAFTLHRHVARLRMWGRFPQRRLRANQFVLPVLRMARYPSVLFPAVYFGAAYGLASILPSLTVAAIFQERFGFTVLQTGAAYGTALTVGAISGELAAGSVVDAIIKREQKRANGRAVHPEARLKAVWTGEILVPAGLLIYGFCVATADTHWSGAVIGMGIACFGVQVIMTTMYTYSIDCYKPQAGEVSQLFNLVRQELGMSLGFFALPLGRAIGFQFEFLLFALVGSGVLFVPIVALMWKGAEWRERMSVSTPEQEESG